jgi:hypothetical protein
MTADTQRTGNIRRQSASPERFQPRPSRVRNQCFIMSVTVFSPHPRLVNLRLRVNRRLMVWLAVRRQGCAFGLHL